MATVLSQHKKENSNILKIKLDNSFIFYTSTKEDIKNLEKIKIRIYTKNLSFISSLKVPYIPSYILEVYNSNSIKNQLINKLNIRHKDKNVQNLYNALFFASTVNPKLRETLTFFGINHLIAISGFHIGILFLILYIIIKPIYRFFADNFFPYLHIQRDVSIISMVIIFLYMYMLSFPIPLVRAFFTLAFILFLKDRYIEIFNFEKLSIIILLILALNIEYLFSVSFFLSITGVFYIYIFLKYFPYKNKILIAIFLNVYLFFTMSIIVYFFFNKFSYTQISSIILSILFPIFYLTNIISHLLNLCSLFDEYLIEAINMKKSLIEINVPIYLLIFHILSSLLAIKYKILSYLIMFNFSIILIL